MEEAEVPAVDTEVAWKAREDVMKTVLRSRWDAEATAFVFPWGHMILSLEDVSRITGLRVYGRPFDNLSASEWQTSTSGFFPFLQVWAYLHLPDLRRGILTRPGLVPIARCWDSRRDTHTLEDQLASIQDEIDTYPQLDRSLGLRQSVVEFPSRDQTARPGRSFRRLHDRPDWRVWAKEKIDNWERKGKQVRSEATSDDAYLQAFALRYGVRVYRGRRRQIDVAGEIASLRALLHSTVQDRAAAQRETEQLRKELERVRRAAGAGASSARAPESSQLDLEDRLAAIGRELRTATNCTSQLQGQVDTATGERDRLRIRAEAA
ncbi:hypothetical protein Taro_008848 [Colocasia esculenta]|uniref:Aminotransferase-like plant mobile domain-containing protein n=1 Tax=Colocasia esculenta TaxID=4460 RepID=A0A843U4P7_COLES|nr:hypothetical protein [Colocasia esculenta]